VVLLNCIALYSVYDRWLDRIIATLDLHYRSKVWGHLEMSYFSKKSTIFSIKITLIKNTHYTLLMW